MSWEPLANMKEAYPLQTAEYAVTNQLECRLALACWVGYTLWHTTQIIKAVKNKHYHRRTHKFGIELRKTVCEALEIYHNTGTTFWCAALELEMKNVRVAFNVLKDGDNVPVG